MHFQYIMVRKGIGGKSIDPRDSSGLEFYESLALTIAISEGVFARPRTAAETSGDCLRSGIVTCFRFFVFLGTFGFPA